MIEGIDVYGATEQINTQFQINLHYAYFEKEFQNVAKQKGFAKAVPQEPIDYFDRIEAVLDPSKRYIQIIVPRSLYEVFETEAKAGGIGFVSWIKEHAKEMNRMIAELKPPTDLETIIKRIIVVDDSFNPKNPVQTSLNKLPDNPWDIDAWDQDNFWTDPRKVSSYVGKILSENGSEIPIDYGVIHEWFHGLYSVQDEYFQDIQRTMSIPDFFVMGDGLKKGILPEINKMRRTPWITACLKWFKENNVRGFYRSKKGGGHGNVGGYVNVNFYDLPGNGCMIWSLRPDSIELNFTGPEGKKLSGDVEILTAKFPEATSKENYGLKAIGGVRTSELENGLLRLENGDFIGNQFKDGSYISTTNFIFRIKTNDGRIQTLHLPVSAFNMSTIAGKKDAKYTIEFSRDINEDENKVQMLEMLNQSEITPELLRDHPPDVRMKVDGTDDYFYWYISKNRPNRLSP